MTHTLNFVLITLAVLVFGSGCPSKKKPGGGTKPAATVDFQFNAGTCKRSDVTLTVTKAVIRSEGAFMKLCGGRLKYLTRLK